MRRMIIRLVLSVMAAAALSLPSTTVAEAATPGCVTMKEFKKADDGMTRKRVAHIFDTAGRVVRRTEHRRAVRYRGCGGNGAYARIVYKDSGGAWRYYSGFAYLN